MSESKSSYYILGIEGGATRTSILFVDSNDEIIEQFTAGPSNLRLMSKDDLESHLRAIRDRLPYLPDTIGIGLAGVRQKADLETLRTKVARIWPGIPCAPTDDLLTALEAEPWPEECDSQVLVLSGTGSCFLGRTRDGKELRIGGRGHILGDRASACEIAQDALREVMAVYDADEVWSPLATGILNQLQLNDPEELIDWSLVATKTELASVAKTVFETAKNNQDPISIRILKEAADKLADDAVSTARRLDLSRSDKIQFVYNGGVLLKNPEFREKVDLLILREFPNAILSPLNRASTWGAVELGRKVLEKGNIGYTPQDKLLPKEDPETIPPVWHPAERSPTEERNPKSENLSSLSLADAIKLFAEEDRSIPDAILSASNEIQWTILKVIESFNNGGRLIYTGAGTSGRLGVLDASECPPTFRSPEKQVQGIMAGGRKALWSATEGSEDDAAAGARAISYRKINEKDIVIAISASGHAPFIWGALTEAKKLGATTVLLTCHPAYRKHPLPDQVIALDTGAEILTGSTRLRAGTATKMTLNMITTLAMTRTGKVISNLMVDLNPSNTKLRDRACRIVAILAAVSKDDAHTALKECGWVVREAIQILNIKNNHLS